MFLTVYADYLRNGGRKEDFERLTPEDVELMFTVSQSERMWMAKTIGKMISSMFGAKTI